MSFFDSLDRTRLQEMLQVRVADGSLLRLIGKLLRVGVLDGEAYITPDRGTAQGSGLSPLLGNVYLHYALDVWFDQVVRPRLRGRATLVRYADDFVIGFERRGARDGCLAHAAGTLRTHTACGQDPCAAVWATASTATAGQRSGLIRLLGVHAALATSPQEDLRS